MKLICNKYQYGPTVEAENRNIFSAVPPTLIETVDLVNYLVRESMSDVEFSFESLTSGQSENTLSGESANVSFQCKNNIIGLTALQDFFEMYVESDYFKWVVDYYGDDGLRKNRYVVYKDGTKFSQRKDNLIDVLCIGFERDCKEYYQNKPLVDPAGLVSVPSGINGLKWYRLRNIIKKNFFNVAFDFDHDTTAIVYDYIISEKPFTYSEGTGYNSPFEDQGNMLHIKTGYLCYYQDGIDMFTFLNSILQPMGWIWFFLNGIMVIQERVNTDYPILTLDANAVTIKHSVSHLTGQQVDNIIIRDGEYYDNDTNAGALHINQNYKLAGETAYAHSGKASYFNQVRPFRDVRRFGVANGQYQLNPSSGVAYPFTVFVRANKYQTSINRIVIARFSGGGTIEYTVTSGYYNYDSKKTLTIEPYVNSRDNSGGFDINLANEGNGIYYGYGNFFDTGSYTDSMILYNGSAANAIFKINPSTGKYVNYEHYTQSEAFRNNFKKFVRSSDTLIIDIEVKQLITDPRQRIQIVNYNYEPSINNKIFSIVKLGYNEYINDSRLTLQLAESR